MINYSFIGYIEKRKSSCHLTWILYSSIEVSYDLIGVRLNLVAYILRNCMACWLVFEHVCGWLICAFDNAWMNKLLIDELVLIWYMIVKCTYKIECTCDIILRDSKSENINSYYYYGSDITLVQYYDYVLVSRWYNIIIMDWVPRWYYTWILVCPLQIRTSWTEVRSFNMCLQINVLRCELVWYVVIIMKKMKIYIWDWWGCKSMIAMWLLDCKVHDYLWNLFVLICICCWHFSADLEWLFDWGNYLLCVDALSICLFDL